MGGGTGFDSSHVCLLTGCVVVQQYKLEASFLEIYNETIRDLLSNSSASHDIKIDPANSGVFVHNAL